MGKPGFGLGLGLGPQVHAGLVALERARLLALRMTDTTQNNVIRVAQSGVSSTTLPEDLYAIRWADLGTAHALETGAYNE